MDLQHLSIGARFHEDGAHFIFHAHGDGDGTCIVRRLGVLHSYMAISTTFVDIKFNSKRIRTSLK